MPELSSGEGILRVGRLHWGSLRSHMFLCLFQVLGSGRRMPCTFRLCQWPELHSCMRFCQWLELGNKCSPVHFLRCSSDTGRQTALGHRALPYVLVLTPRARVRSFVAGSMAVGMIVYAVSSDTDSTGKSHVVVHMKSTPAKQATLPFACGSCFKSFN